MQTFIAKAETVQQNWYVVDATALTLGRLASEIARRLRGKHKPEFTPYMDAGDYIVVVNAEKIRVTGNKAEDKMYHSYSGYQSGLKTTNLGKLLEKDAPKVLEIAVKGMLPKGPLGRQVFSKLKVYAGDKHPHTAQQPQPLNLSEI